MNLLHEIGQKIEREVCGSRAGIETRIEAEVDRIGTGMRSGRRSSEKFVARARALKPASRPK
jgi:hypothetical protein